MSEDYESVVRLDIAAEVVDKNAALLEIDDLAWDHAKEFAQEMGFSIGSEEFTDIYMTMKERYEHQVEHLKFFMTTALITMRELLMNNLVALPSESEALTEDEAVNAITSAAQCLVGSYMWLSASHELFWPMDESMPDNTAISFYFDINDVQLSEEE